MAILLITTAAASAANLHKETTGCATETSKTAVGWLYFTRVCVGDTARARDFACPSVEDLYAADKLREGAGCKDISGLTLRVVEVYQEAEDNAHACGIDYNRNKWCMPVFGFAGATAVMRPDGRIFKE